MSVDAVVVRGIRIDASLGILDWERQVRQPIEVDIEADVDTSELLASGDLAHGVDFTRVIEAVHAVVGARHEDLVEVLADRIAGAVLAATPAQSVRVEVRKYSACASAANHVGVRLVRHRT